MQDDSEQTLRERIAELTQEHRDLDDAITGLTQQPYINQLQLQRMKKRKLMLKDQLARLRSQLIPDLNA
jgi:hypothetical protein